MPTVLCFGDSNTFGTATVPRPDGRYAPDERWTGVLRRELGAGWQVVEEGLGGRTTVTEDPMEPYPDKNGARALPIALYSHRPIDLVIVMLGTNDLKQRFGKTPWTIAEGMGALADVVLAAPVGPGGRPPKLLVVSPPVVLDELPNHAAMFAGGPEKSRALAAHYRTIAAARGAGFFDAGSVAQSSRFDGFHLDPDAHVAIGQAMAGAVRAALA